MVKYHVLQDYSSVDGPLITKCTGLDFSPQDDWFLAMGLGEHIREEKILPHGVQARAGLDLGRLRLHYVWQNHLRQDQIAQAQGSAPDRGLLSPALRVARSTLP